MSDLGSVVATGSFRGKWRSCRTFNLGDGLTLVAALALAMGLVRAVLIKYAESLTDVLINNREILAGFLCVPMVLIPATFASLAFRFRSPHPRGRRLTRQPGLVACGAAVVAVVLALAIDLGRAARVGMIPSAWTLSFRLLEPVGHVVLVAWLVLAVSGRWRLEPGWIDRFGRAIGGSWIALSLAWAGWLIYNRN